VLTTEALETAFDARGVVTTNPVTDSPAVTTLPSTAGGESGPRPGRRPDRCQRRRIVLGSGPPGERGPLLSRRRRPVRRTDARRPGRDDAPPFTAIDSATVDAVGERIAAADVTVLADPVIDPAATLCRLAGPPNGWSSSNRAHSPNATTPANGGGSDTRHCGGERGSWTQTECRPSSTKKRDQARSFADD